MEIKTGYHYQYCYELASEILKFIDRLPREKEMNEWKLRFYY